MIKILNIKKKFYEKNVIDDISLEIETGVIFGLLGANGAGKTTLIRILCGLLKSDFGTITINNKPIEESKKNFGYVSQSFGQYEELSVWENIVFYAQMYGVKDSTLLEDLLKRYNLYQYKNTLAGDLSGGYKRRLALVCALSHNPKVLFLDEPTAGIDPVTRKLLWDDFYALSMEGKTLFVTTHYMEEAQRCHQLAFLSAGKIVAQGTPLTIKDTLKDVSLFTVQLPYNPQIIDFLSNNEDILLLNQFGNELRIMLKPQADIQKINNVLKNQFYQNKILKEGSINLEDLFITLTQRNE